MSNKTPLQFTILIIVNILFVANALAISCDDGSGVFDSAGKVYSDCREGEKKVDGLAEINNVSTPFFDIDDWVLLTKIEDGQVIGGVKQPDKEEVNVDIDLTVSGLGTATGNWSFNSTYWNTYESIFVVLKGGSSTPSWAAFLLKDDASSGTWKFITENKNGLSHFSVYGADTASAVPEPATMLLFGAGLVGLAGFRLRRRN